MIVQTPILENNLVASSQEDTIMRLVRLSLFVVAFVLPVDLASGQWRSVAPGIEYREFHIEGPTEACVARADRTRKHWTIDTCIGQGMLKSGRETVSGLAERYDESVNFRGERYDVKVAINGDYFSFKTDQPPSGQIIGGWFVKRFMEYSGGSGFVWRADRRCFLGGNVRNGKKLQRVVFSDSTEMAISKMNAVRGPDELVLYTPHYADRTHTSDDGVEVVVRVSEPVGVDVQSRPAKGTVVEVRKGAASTTLPFDHVVLSGQGGAAAKLSQHAKVGQDVRIELRVKDYGVNDLNLKPGEWPSAYASIGGHFYCVTEGRVPADRWEAKGKPGAINRHPRTAVSFNDHYVHFIVVDGRSKKSIGMTVTELGRFCADHLEAEYAIAQDGGGSSTMWLDGKVMNVPSDGKQRPVANGYMMAMVHEPERSKSFLPGVRVRAKQDAALRLGPGTNFAAAGRIPSGQSSVIIEHRLNGIRAKGTHWWHCRSPADDEGWVSEDKLTRPR